MNYIDDDILVNNIIELLKHGNFEAAIKTAEENHHLMADNIVQECIGHIAFHRNSYPITISHYENAMKIKPDRNSPRYHYLVAIQEYQEERWVESFERFQYAIDSDPNFLEPYLGMKKLLLKVEDPEGVEKCQEQIDRILRDSIYSIEKFNEIELILKTALES